MNGEFGTTVQTTEPLIISRSENNRFVDATQNVLISDSSEVFVRQQQSYQKLSTNIKIKRILHPTSSEATLLSTDGKLYTLKDTNLEPMHFVPDIGLPAVDLRMSHGCTQYLETNGTIYRIYIQDSVNITYSPTTLAFNNITKLVCAPMFDVTGTHQAVLLSNGTIVMWGNNADYQLGNGVNSVVQGSYTVKMPGNEAIVDAALGATFSVVLTASGNVYYWGRMKDRLYDYMQSTITRINFNGKKINKITAGINYFMAIAEDGTPYAMGVNTVSQLAGIYIHFTDLTYKDGTTTSREAPVVARHLRGDIQHLSTFSYFTTVVYADKILVWNNAFSDAPVKSKFVRMNTDVMRSRVVEISSAVLYSLLLTEDGKVYATGRNRDYSLGDGSREDPIMPIAVNMDDALYGLNVTKIYASPIGTSYAIATDGYLYIWGGRQSSIQLSCVKEVPMVPFKLLQYQQVQEIAGIIITQKDGVPYTCWQNGTIRKFPVPEQLQGKPFSRMQTIPDSISSFLYSGEDILLYSDTEAMNALKPLFVTLLTGEFYVGWLKPTPFFSFSDVARVTLWEMNKQPHLVAVLKDGRSFIANGATSWQTYYTDLDVERTTESILMFKNNTMLVYWRNTQPPVRVVPVPFTDDIKYVRKVARTSLGVSAIMYKCSPSYTDNNCATPVCFGIAQNDSSVCNGNGRCVSPQVCACDPLYTGKDCKSQSDLAKTLIGLGIAALVVSCTTVVVIATVLITVCSYRTIRTIVKQRKAEIEMKMLLNQSLVMNDQLQEMVEKDWVIPLGDLTFVERLSEGSFGVVFKGKYQNADV
jgi:alpha-tubulin suppressor-like RCC1 family protein